MIRLTNIQAIESSTGLDWSSWTDYLEQFRDLEHPALARKVLEKLQASGATGNLEWWAQNVTVAYEQYIGRRLPGQSKDGSFSVSVSKTVAGNMDSVISSWLDLIHKASQLNGLIVKSDSDVSRTDKWRYWRAKLSDDTRLVVSVQGQNYGEKSILTVTHNRLSGLSDIKSWRLFWRQFLSQM